MLIPLASFVLRRPFAALFATALAVFGVHLLTIAEYPPAWFDEIEILEMGRFSIFDIRPEWSVNLIPQADGSFVAPYPLFHYLSGALLEALYRLTGGFICGRAVMLASLPCCMFALFAWLRTKPIAPAFAFVAALLFLVDPNATICAHWYRPDLWCMSMTFLALVAIARARMSRFPHMLYFFAGVLTATAIFFWITSVLFLPLILLESCLPGNGEPFCPKALPSRLLSLVAGGVLITAVLLIPHCQYISQIIVQYLSRSEIATITTASDSPLAAVVARSADLVKIACRSPFVWGAACVGVVAAKRFRIHAALFVLLILFMLATRVYHLRMVYLMPYLFLLAAAGIDHLAQNAKRTVACTSHAYVTLALIFGTALSICALNFAAWPEGNTLSVVSRQLHNALPLSSPKVYLFDFEHELYYAGRANGWRMYSTNPRELVFDERYASFLDGMDAVIVSSVTPGLTAAQERTLAGHGFVRAGRIAMPPAATGTVKRRLAGIFYAHGYPDCEIWRRKP